MAKRQVTQFLYDRLVEGYRQFPGNASKAAKFAGCDRRLASRTWEKGWPARSWALPIKDFLEQEKVQVRAARQSANDDRLRVEDEQRQKSYQDAIEAQKHEAIASQAARVNSIALANMTSRVISPLLKVAEDLAQDIRNGKHTFTPQQALKLMSQIAYVQRNANESIKLALQIERLRVGDPTDIFKVTSEAELSDEEVLDQLMGISRTIRRVEKRTLTTPNLTLINGGNGQYPPPDETREPTGPVTH